MGTTYSSLNSKRLDIDYKARYYFAWQTGSGPSSKLQKSLGK